MAARLQPPAPALESRLPGAAGVRGKESRELGRRAHRLASRAGRRGAMRAGLGSKTRQFFSRPQRVKGGRKNWDEDETKATNNTPQEGRNNRRTLLITGGKLGCRPLAVQVASSACETVEDDALKISSKSVMRGAVHVRAN